MDLNFSYTNLRAYARLLCCCFLKLVYLVFVFFLSIITCVRKVKLFFVIFSTYYWCGDRSGISCRVTTKQSPQLRVFFKQKPITPTLDTGAKTSMIKASVVRSLGLSIEKFFQKTLQADCTTPLIVHGEIHVSLSRSNKQLILDALVVEDLDADVLAGVPFLIANDISVRPATQQITIHGFETLYYLSKDKHNIDTHTVRAATSYVLRSSSPTTVIWPGEYFEVDVPPELGIDSTITVEPRYAHTVSVRSPDFLNMWPTPHIVDSVGGRIQHLAGTASLPSDFASTAPLCQICSFIRESENSVVWGVSVQDIINITKSLPFTARSAWRDIQNQCPDFRRVHAHLKQGTRPPSKKLTNVKDVKRYLNIASISKDSLLVVKRHQPFTATTEAVIVPRSVLDGLLTTLHIYFQHPSRHQLQTVTQRHFFALDMGDALTRVTSTCHTCASLKKLPSSLITLPSENPLDAVGVSFAADVIKRNKQLILSLRECSTSCNATCPISDETHATLRDALTRLLIELHPLDVPRAVIRVDSAPGFLSLARNDSLKHLIV